MIMLDYELLRSFDCGNCTDRLARERCCPQMGCEPVTAVIQYKDTEYGRCPRAELGYPRLNHFIAIAEMVRTAGLKLDRHIGADVAQAVAFICAFWHGEDLTFQSNLAMIGRVPL